jgi:hypothetical protein
MNDAVVVLIAVLPLKKKRPILQELIGAVFGVGSVVGP